MCWLKLKREWLQQLADQATVELAYFLSAEVVVHGQAI